MACVYWGGGIIRHCPLSLLRLLHALPKYIVSGPIPLSLLPRCDGPRSYPGPTTAHLEPHHTPSLFFFFQLKRVCSQQTPGDDYKKCLNKLMSLKIMQISPSCMKLSSFGIWQNALEIEFSQGSVAISQASQIITEAREASPFSDNKC